MLLTFDFQSGVQLYLQLRNQVVIGIAQGRLRPRNRYSGRRLRSTCAGCGTRKPLNYLIMRRRVAKARQRDGSTALQTIDW